MRISIDQWEIEQIIAKEIASRLNGAELTTDASNTNVIRFESGEIAVQCYLFSKPKKAKKKS